MTETTTSFDTLLKEREKAKKMERKWRNKVSELTNLINTTCEHSQTQTVTKYYEGSYYNRAEYHTINECIICKKELDRKIDVGSYG